MPPVKHQAGQRRLPPGVPNGSLLTLGEGRGMPWVTRECPGVCDDATRAVSCGAGPAGGLCGPV